MGLTTLFSSQSFAQDGKSLYSTRFCITCHGENGKAVINNYPSLAGQNPQYMIAQVREILAGKRKSDLTILMTNNPIIKNLSDKELQAIIKYIASLK